MLDLFLKYINPIKIIVLLTLLLGFVYLKKNNTIHQKVLALLMVSFLTEYSIFIFFYYKRSIFLMYSVSFVIHHSLWILLLRDFVDYKGRILLWMLLFIVFGVLNMTFFEGSNSINYYTFLLGAFIYLYFFISESFTQLQRDNFSFLTSNNYILLFSPVLFFLGYSFMFAFQDYSVISTKLFGKIELYDFIGNLVNGIYYFVLNLYIFKEKKCNG